MRIPGLTLSKSAGIEPTDSSAWVFCYRESLMMSAGDDLHIEWHDGRVWLDYAVKDLTKTLSDGAIAVSCLLMKRRMSQQLERLYHDIQLLYNLHMSKFQH